MENELTIEWRDVTDSDLNSALQSFILENDQIASLNLIKYFHQRFEDVGLDGCPQGSIGILCQFMQHVFSKMIVDKCNADQALGLKTQRGKYKRVNNELRNYELTAHVKLLMLEGEPWEKAVGNTANKYFGANHGDKAVADAYATNKKIFEMCNFSKNDLKAIIDGALRS
jgi:hypothetical protein